MSLVFALALTGFASGTAGAQTDPYTGDTGTEVEGDGDGTQVIGNEITNTGAEVKGSQVSNTNTGALALTGVETMTIALVGVTMLLGGIGFVVYSKRSDQAV